ncbi:MFS transporter [Oricola cellulosilytica]|uniref:MFS transporter n=1 Tax=Oricola cellulosilytica TaxID=1429082 RepID=A0A4R0PCN9_9HYPH|nr:MFS transporter [Oricola cellulosilytica]TCD13854.1 MFS transporter [Oricola cellulosilytica]
MTTADSDNRQSGAVHTGIRRRGIWSWMLFDWAAQPFHTLIITFIFAPYFAAHVAPNETEGQALWGFAAGAGGLAIAFLSPVLGAISDATGPRKPWIFGFSLLGALGVFSLWYVTPAAGGAMILFALASFTIALIGFEFAAVFNNAMMPGLVSRERLGGLSGNAWALGYAGGLICLILMLTLMVASPETGKTLAGLDPVLGLNPQLLEGDRASGPFTALWYAIFIIPLFLFTPDAARNTRVAGAVVRGLRELRQTVRHLPRERSLFSFLLSSMFYRDALNGLYAFGGIYAVGVLGWSIIQLGVFGILTSITGIFGCLLGGWLDNRIGTKRVVTTSIVCLIVAGFMVVSTGSAEIFYFPVAAGSVAPDVVFYCAGALIGAAGGALQASSRPLLVDQAEPDRMGEAFGLYALSGRATAFLAPWGVGVMTTISGSQRIGITPILILFVIGLLFLIPVRSKA